MLDFALKVAARSHEIEDKDYEELKSHGFSSEERREASTSLLGYVGAEKILPLSFEVLAEATALESVSGYFDALIASTARLNGASVVSKDTAFTEMGVKIEW